VAAVQQDGGQFFWLFFEIEIISQFSAFVSQQTAVVGVIASNIAQCCFYCG